MDKDLVVIIQTRQRPSQATKTIKMFYDTCSSKNNFDIFCIVDDDDVHNYDEVKTLFPEVKWKIVHHVGKSWIHILQGQHDIIFPNQYYFNWVVTDDFHGLSPNWDTDIISKKNIFKDDLFALYTNSTLAGRNPRICDECYMFCDNDIDNGSIILRHNEMLPICTKKWVELMSGVFANGDYSSSRELITASLIYKLKKEFNINRHILTELSYGSVDSGPDTINTSNLVLNNDGLNRDESFEKMVFNNFKPIDAVLSQMYQYIQSYE